VAAAAVITPSIFRLADRIRVQRDTVRDRRYTQIGKLTAIVFEAQRPISGYSQSRARWWNSRQAKELKDQPGMHPFSEEQAKLWASITLDWLNQKNAPMIGISRDQVDLLLPAGLNPLPDIPDPRWMPKHARNACFRGKDGCSECVPPRIPQLLTGCPVVGDRVRDMIRSRQGRCWGVLHPITELCVMLGGAQGGFGVIRGGVGRDGTHLSLLINPEQTEGYFVGGRFILGG